MAVHGDLRTMPLPELLQWLGMCRKTGVLHVERDGVTRWIAFREGRVRACSSDDPPMLLGQFLLSRGAIAAGVLRDALARQEVTGESLNAILVEEGHLTREDLDRHVAAKAEETIYGMFDWEDAAFRFDPEGVPDSKSIAVDLDVAAVVMRGLRRQDEMHRVREILGDPGIVLRRTGVEPPPVVTGNRMSRAIFDLIDGNRTLRELLLHAHASEYLVLRFLHGLLRGGVVEIHEVRAAPRSVSTETGMEEATVPGGGSSSPAAVAEATAVFPEVATDLAAEVKCVLRMSQEGRYEEALTLLQRIRESRPAESALKELRTKVESAHYEHLATREVPVDKTPVLVGDPGGSGASDPETRFLTSLLDGRNDIKAILWLSPMRSLDVLRALKRMKDSGLVELH